MSSAEALKILGLESNAKVSEIKGAYRDLVKVWHPDRFGNDLPLRRKAEEHLKQINLAYQCLQGYSPTPDPTPDKSQRSSESSSPHSTHRDSPHAGKHDAGTKTDSNHSQSDSSTTPSPANAPAGDSKSGFSPWVYCLYAVIVISYLGYRYTDDHAQLKSVPPVITKDTYNAGHTPMTLEEAFSTGQHPSSTEPNLSKNTSHSVLPSRSASDFSYINGLPTFEQRTTAIADRLASVKADPKYQALPEQTKTKVLANLYRKYILSAYSDFHRPVPDENTWVEANR